MYKYSYRSAYENIQEKLNSSLESCKNEVNQLRHSESNSFIMKAEMAEISQESSKKMSLKALSELKFQYYYSNHIKNLKFSLVEMIRKLLFSDNFIKNLIQNMKDMKKMYELNSKEMMIIKDEKEKLKVENDNLHIKNSNMKTSIINLKNENMGLKDQNIYLVDYRIEQNTKFVNEQRKQKSFLLNLKDISQSEQNKNILLQ